MLNVTMSYRSIAKAGATVFCVTVYFSLFGLESLMRYIDRDVIIKKRIETRDSMPPPGNTLIVNTESYDNLDIYLAPLNLQTSQPWKTLPDTTYELGLYHVSSSFINCSQEEGMKLKKCIEAIAYSPEEVVIATNHQGTIEVNEIIH